MAGAKPKATIMVADCAGGIVRVQNRRFEPGDWPIGFQMAVPMTRRSRLSASEGAAVCARSAGVPLESRLTRLSAVVLALRRRRNCR